MRRGELARRAMVLFRRFAIFGLCLAIVVASAASGDAPSAAGLSALGSEDEALEVLARPTFDIASPALAAEVEQLVHRGWHDAIRALVTRSFSVSEEVTQKVAAQVRHAVYAERNRLDDLIRALDRNYGKAVDVSPAMQWAQNSTHVFITVKFAQRWNAPGALEVENETVAFSSCCFNFTAFGEHSFIRRRYHLSFELFQPMIAASSSWFLAAAGRMTVTIAKGKPANWPRLFRSAEAQPKNLGVWRDMREKWKSDLEKFAVEEDGSKKTTATPADAEKKTSSKKQKRKRKAVEKEDDDDALDKEVELLSDCPAKSTFDGTSVAELCGKTFREVVEESAVPGRRWLVQLYSSQGTGDEEAMRSLIPTWKRLADIFPSVTPGGRVGAVDCAQVSEKELCKRLGASKLPQIRRFSAGAKSDTWDGSFDVEALAAWGGGGKEEL